MWNKYRFSFHFYIYLYVTDRWTFLKHLFHHIIFLLKNIKAPRCDLEEKGDHLCKHVIPLPLVPEHPCSFWGYGVLCVSFLPIWRKGAHRAAPRGLWVLWCHGLSLSSVVLPRQAQGGKCHLEMAPNANLRRNRPQCLEYRANISWLVLLFSLQNVSV